MKYISSNILKDHTWATEVKVLDLPINPISHLLITLQGFNETNESTLAEILAFLNEVEVTYKGQTILSLESEDLFALNCYLLGAAPVLTTSIATDNVSRALTLVVPFGRKLYDPKECLHGSRKGEMQLRLDCTVPATSFDNGIINVQAIELPDATPERYLKNTLLKVSAPGATGDNDVELPIGNPIAGIMLFSTTMFQTSSHTQGIDEVKVMVDNVEHGIVSGKTLSIYGESINRIQTLARVPAAAGENILQHYILLDYDPAQNDEFLLQTAGKSSVKTRLTMGVDEASKVIPIELVRVA